MTRNCLGHVVGILRTNSDGERYIKPSGISDEGSGSIRSLGMPNRSVGGGDWRYQPGESWPQTLSGQKGIAGSSGLNNIGLLVTTWGKFAKTSDTTFTLDDGSGVMLRCVFAEQDMPEPTPTYAVVTGISSCEKVGEELRRLLRVREQADIVDFNSLLVWRLPTRHIRIAHAGHDKFSVVCLDFFYPRCARVSSGCLKSRQPAGVTKSSL